MDTNIKNINEESLEKVTGGDLIDWVAQNIAIPLKEFYTATELNTAQNCMAADNKGRQ